MRDRQPLLDASTAELEAYLEGLGEPRYRVDQIREWIYRRGAQRFEVMTNLPTRLREQLAADWLPRAGRELARAEAPDGTIKLLLRWPDGATTETVMIPAPESAGRRTACLSTQVGCDVGCRFCASGIGGSQRDLSAGEIVEQALVIRDLLSARQERLSHIVYMGMGEPLANYEATVDSVRRLVATAGLGLAQRRITISTVGLPKQIERLAGEALQVTLALSLHAPNEALRRELIPWARGVPLARLLAACGTYRSRTGREITLEYCLLAGINDRREHLADLATIARELDAHVNLLLYNPVAGLPYARPDRRQAHDFLKELRSRGVKAHLRESRGLEADAACGQLRRRSSG